MQWPSTRAVSTALAFFALSFTMGSAARAEENPSTSASSQATQTAAPSRHLTRGQYLAKSALQYRGMPYRWGGTGPRGYDCSGLTQAVYRKYGMMIKRTAIEQFHQGKPVTKAELQAGDLVFFKNTYRKGISHVGIYIGEGHFLHAAGRKKGVIVSDLNTPFYQHHLAGARRLDLTKMPELPDDERGDDPIILPDNDPAAMKGVEFTADIPAGK